MIVKWPAGPNPEAFREPAEIARPGKRQQPVTLAGRTAETCGVKNDQN